MQAVDSAPFPFIQRSGDLMAVNRSRYVLYLALASGLILGLAHGQQAGVHRTNLQQHDLSVPGWEAVQVKIEIDPGKMVPKHTHPGEEIVYMLSGSLEYQLGDQDPVTVKAGEVMFIPAGIVHTAKNVSGSDAAEISTYIVQKGKPLAQWVK